MKKYSKLLLDQEPVYRIHSVDVNGNNRPRDLYDVMHYVAIGITNNTKCGSLKEGFLSPNSLIISWSPSLCTLFLSLLGRNVFYLCWGVPCHTSTIIGRLKKYKLKILLCNVKNIFVNDKDTQNDVKKMTGIVPAKLNYVVDNEFFQYAPYIDREDYILVPGNNDRDESLILALAKSGYRVIRMTRDEVVASIYKNIRSNIPIELCYRVSVGRVRELYQNAKVVLLPITSSNHAAGQTAVLEAISCGAPVIITEGRASSIIKEYPTAVTCYTNNLSEWREAIDNIIIKENEIGDALYYSSKQVHKNHSPKVVTESIISRLR